MSSNRRKSCCCSLDFVGFVDPIPHQFSYLSCISRCQMTCFPFQSFNMIDRFIFVSESSQSAVSEDFMRVQF